MLQQLQIGGVSSRVLIGATSTELTRRGRLATLGASCGGHQLRLRAARKHYQPIRDSGNNLRAHYAKHTAAQHDSPIISYYVRLNPSFCIR